MEPISKEEADEMRYVLGTLFGGQTANWKINAEVYELFGQLAEKSGTCTDAVDLLPRPYSGPPTLKWAMKQVRQDDAARGHRGDTIRPGAPSGPVLVQEDAMSAYTVAVIRETRFGTEVKACL